MNPFDPYRPEKPENFAQTVWLNRDTPKIGCGPPKYG
jgi:hypothetical protein